MLNIHRSNSNRFLTWQLVLLLLILGGCDSDDVDRSAVDREVDTIQVQAVNFKDQVAPILNNRCVVCHGCYDAPCQLKLSSYEGLQRGANKAAVYDGTRLTADPLTRLFVDADSISAWRDKEFFTVLTESEKGSVKESVMHRMLTLKRQFPLPVGHNEKLADDEFEIKLARDNVCPTGDEMDDYSNDRKLHGMPFGLPALDADEQQILLDWLDAGALTGPAPALQPAYREAIDQWEAFFNGDSNKQRLMARYIYEHIYFANLYFSELSDSKWFEIVRSTTPPGQPIRIIATRRPFDGPRTDRSIDTDIERVYYRIRPLKNSIVAKNHMPYALNSERLQRFENLFLAPDYEVSRLPGYSPELTTNPFETFIAMPTHSRYRFMIEQAKFTIRGFMKGTVCRGQVALNVINDHFWVFFADPKETVFNEWNARLPRQIDRLDLPAERSSTAGVLAHWTEYSDSQSIYLQAKSRMFNEITKTRRPSLQWVWDGDGKNENASLSVFRHFDSASVVQGLVGPAPKTAWLIDYPILERIHYLLVAGFDVYGNAGHQLATRLYMDFLRMESEFNFLALLPQDARLEVRDHWYRGADKQVLDYVYGDYANLSVAPEIDYPADKAAKQQLYALLKSRLEPVLPVTHLIEASQVSEAHRQLKQLFRVSGEAATLMPEMSLLMVTNSSQDHKLYTIFRNSAHSNITSLFLEHANRLPGEDNLTVMPGVVGAHPDALWRVSETELADFIADLGQLRSEADFAAMMERYGIRRSHREFWQHSDSLHLLYRQNEPVEFGILDFSRLENR